MKKLEHIEIQGHHFPIQKNALIILEKYLNSIRNHFIKLDDNTDIIDDLESRIAEKFNTEILNKRHKIITLSDVNIVIDEMGKVEDMENNDEDEINSEVIDQKINKKFFRSSDDALLGGVAAGIAHYFNWEVTLVRLLLLASIPLGGYSIPLYVAIWLITPTAKSTTEKMQMRGDKITISSVEKNISEELNKLPERATAIQQKTNSFLARQNWLRNILIIGLKTFGFLLTVAMLTGLVGLIFSLIFIFFNLHHPYIDPAIGEIASTLSEPWIMPTLFTSILFIAAIPLWFMMLLGLSIFKWKKVFGTTTIIALLTIWLSSIGVTSTLALLYMPNLESKTQEIITRRQNAIGSRSMEKEFPFTNFDSLMIDDYSYVVLHQGDYKIKARGSESVVQKLNITQDNTTLLIKDSEPLKQTDPRCWFGCPNHMSIIEVWMPDLQTAIINNSSTLTTAIDEPFISSKALAVSAHDNASVVLTLQIPELNLHQDNTSRSILNGTVQNAIINLSNNSQADLRSLQTTRASVIVNNNAFLELSVSESLKAEANNNSSIYYLGTPTVDKKETNNARIYGDDTVQATESYDQF